MAHGNEDRILPDDRKASYPMKVLERRYTPSGRVAHLIHDVDWQTQVPHALCGWWAWKDYWLGTGGQGEYERADELPVCRNCERWVQK